ncbi:MAG: type II toxin-antitoxin system RelE/ParE family toxin [Ekhidna sp.]|nr:type II toxin-antitoxin system RelE/ParE family toxin [Ekhidna sp.]
MVVDLEKKGQKNYRKLPEKVRLLMNEKIDRIAQAESFDEVRFIEGRLKGSPDRYKIRQGDYRIILKKVTEQQVIITSIRHRRDVYDKLYSLLLSMP